MADEEQPAEAPGSNVEAPASGMFFVCVLLLLICYVKVTKSMNKSGTGEAATPSAVDAPASEGTASSTGETVPQSSTDANVVAAEAASTTGADGN